MPDSNLETARADLFYSQNGEDCLLAEMFRGVANGLCVEVGANDGIQLSNTYYLERRGWKSILVEPNPQLCQRLRETRSGQVFQCVASARSGSETLLLAEGVDGLSTLVDDSEHRTRILSEGGSIQPLRVTARTLDDILGEAGAKRVDFLSIDVEGAEFEVLQGLSLALWRPRVVLIEDQSGLWGSRVTQHMRRSGYVRIRRTGGNDWYVFRTDGIMRRFSDRRDMYFQHIRTALRDKLPPSLLRWYRRVRGIW